jgi:tRNA (guanine-N7-)-methyltransferase
MISPEISLADPFNPLDWLSLFIEQQPIVLDLGAGEGGFALAYAQQSPEKNILALERLVGRVRRLVRKATTQQTPNLRVLRLETTYTLRYLIPPASVQEIHVLFPDPWPKRKHFDRRLVQPPFMETAVQALRPGGLFRWVTDHQEYFHTNQPGVDAHPGLHRIPDDRSYPVTDFERRFRKQNLPIYGATWQKSSPHHARL